MPSPQVHNALGFAYFNMQRSELAVKNYRKAVELQPGYVTAWNNLGDAFEKAKDWEQVRGCYAVRGSKFVMPIPPGELERC